MFLFLLGLFRKRGMGEKPGPTAKRNRPCAGQTLQELTAMQRVLRSRTLSRREFGSLFFSHGLFFLGQTF